MTAAGWVEGVRRIAVLRANALGDYIFLLPALEALRAAYPQAEIVLLGREWHAAFLSGRPGAVSRAVPVPPSRGVSRPDTWPGPTPGEQVQLEEFMAQMQAERFDLALQMHGGGGNSNPFVRRLGARLTAGMKAPGAPPLDRWIPYEYWQHEIMRLLEVAGLAGAPPVTVEPRLPVTPADLAEASRFIPAGDGPLAVLHPGAGDPRRRWPAGHFARVGDALAGWGCRVAVTGSAGEKDILSEVIEAMRAPAANLGGALSLPGLVGLLAQAALLIGNDSGPRHLAEAVGTPTVGIFWCGNLINAGPAFRTFHRVHLSWRLDCAVCGRNTIHEGCHHSASFVDQVSPEAVIESARDLLSLDGERSPAQGRAVLPLEDPGHAPSGAR